MSPDTQAPPIKAAKFFPELQTTSRRPRCRLAGLAMSVSHLADRLGRKVRPPPAFRRRAAEEPLKSCILIFCNGGPSHLDTFDMKPGAPAEVRGEFQPILTSLPGCPISEHLPKTARLMHRLALIRSMQHRMRGHR